MHRKPFLITNRRLAKRFTEQVSRLWRRKSRHLLDFVERPPGRQATFSRRWREREIDKLQNVLLEAYMPKLRRWVQDGNARLVVKFSRGDPRGERASMVRDAMVQRGLNRKHLVYASFRGDGKCLKVGRSNTGAGRIVQQRKDVAFWNATRVVVYFPHRRKKKVLPALECALTHLLDPIHTDIWPAQIKYHERCPACRDSARIRKLVEGLFPA
jgi:hypothetical protein